MRVLHIFDPRLDPDGPAMRRARALMQAQRRIGLAPIEVSLAPRLGDGAERPGLRALLAGREDARRIAAQIDARHPHVAHAHAPAAAARAALRAGAATRLPVIYDIDDAAAFASADGLRGRLKRWLDRGLLRRVHAMLAPSHAAGALWHAETGAEGGVFVLPEAIEAETAPARRSQALAAQHDLKGKTVIGYSGPLKMSAGVDDLLASLERLRRDRPDIALLALGRADSDADRAALRLAATGKLNGSAVTPRLADESDRAEHESLIDIACLLGGPDSDGGAELARALLNGRLAVAPDTPDNRELIRDGETGWLYRPDDREALQAALKRALDAAGCWPQMRAAARSETLARRGPPAVAERCRDIYLAARRIALAGVA